MYFNSSRLQNLREIQANELLPPISRWTRIGSAVLLGTLSAAFTLAATLKYNVTVQAPATLRPVGDLRIVQAPLTGTLDRITAQDNSVVTQGEAIAFINNSQLQTRQNQLQVKIRQNQRQLTQFQAEIRDQEAERESRIQEARANLELAQSQLSAAESLIKAGAIPELSCKKNVKPSQPPKPDFNKRNLLQVGQVQNCLAVKLNCKLKLNKTKKSYSKLKAIFVKASCVLGSVQFQT